MAVFVLEMPSVGESFVVSAVIVLSGITSAALALIAILAYRRRRSLSYLLVATALVVFALKALVGGLTVAGIVGLGFHHVVEHGLDFLVALLLIGAIYAARSQHRCKPIGGQLERFL